MDKPKQGGMRQAAWSPPRSGNFHATDRFGRFVFRAAVALPGLPPGMGGPPGAPSTAMPGAPGAAMPGAPPSGTGTPTIAPSGQPLAPTGLPPGLHPMIAPPMPNMARPPGH